MNSCNSFPIVATKLIALVTAATFALSANAAPKPKFTVTEVGTLPGGYDTIAFKINNRGQVIGTTVDAAGYRRPFIYRDGIVTAIPGIPAQGTALDINDSGVVVGQYNANNAAHGFLYSDGVLTDLTSLLPGADWVAASGINAAGQIVGWGGPTNDLYPAFWISNGLAGYFPMPARIYYSTAFEVNTAGQAAGDIGVFTNDTGVLQHAYLFQYDRVIDLGVLPGGNLSAARALNEAGHVVGWSFFHSPLPDNRFGVHATLYRDGRVIDLGSLPGFDSSYGWDINNAGWIVGYCEDNSGNLVGFLYADGVMYDLRDLVKKGTEWEFRWPTGVNDLGQIVGWGSLRGELRSFLLTPSKKPAS